MRRHTAVNAKVEMRGKHIGSSAPPSTNEPIVLMKPAKNELNGNVPTKQQYAN